MLCGGGVNLFVMITGWYGVKHIRKGLVRLVADCLTFGAISYILLLLLSVHPFNIKEFIASMMFYKNWFVVSYMMLLLTVPIIETSLRYASLQQQKHWLILLFLFNFVFGYIMGWVNADGYNAIQFVWLYYIARYLRLTKDKEWNMWLSRNGLWIYAACSLGLASCFIFASNIGCAQNTLRWFSYNNILVVMASIGVFMWISDVDIQNKYINLIASGMFGVFLIHTTPYIIPFRNAITYNIFEEYAYWGIFVEACVILVAGFFIAIVVNKISSPIIRILADRSFKVI